MKKIFNKIFLLETYKRPNGRVRIRKAKDFINVRMDNIKEIELELNKCIVSHFDSEVYHYNIPFSTIAYQTRDKQGRYRINGKLSRTEAKYLY